MDDILPFGSVRTLTNGHRAVYVRNENDQLEVDPYIECCWVSGAYGKHGTWCYLSRYLACKVMQRRLHKGEVISFKDKDRLNVVVDNLTVSTKRDLSELNKLTTFQLASLLEDLSIK